MKQKKKLKSELSERRFRVTIFGSARITKKDPAYKQIYTLAKMIGEKEIEIVTGGGPGMMRAASMGHHAGKKNKKTHTIGLTIKLSEKQKHNKYLDVRKDFQRFSRRIDNFMLLSNVIVVAPGGVGTLLEFFYSWQLVQVKQICNIPIILYGPMWDDLIVWLKKHPLKRGFLDKKDLDLLFVAKTPKEAMKIIDTVHKQYNEEGNDFCINTKKYKIDIK